MHAEKSPPMSDYENQYRDFRWEVPEHFNFGAAIDAFGAEPGRPAILCEDQDGNRARLCFADIREQSNRIAFAHTTQFHSEPAEKLAARVLAIAPRNFQNGGRVYFTSGGSEATETAIKLARQYFLESKQPSRYRMGSGSRNMGPHVPTPSAAMWPAARPMRR